MLFWNIMRSPLVVALLSSLASSLASAQAVSYFSGAVSQGTISQKEQSVLAHTISAQSTHGVLTHWWITGGASTDDAIIRIYIDGEYPASLVFTPSLACGVGFDDDSLVPWSIPQMGKQAASGAWHSNFRIPFQSSINVTYQNAPGAADASVYMIARGAENLDFSFGGVQIPTTARMALQINTLTMQPLDYLSVVDIPTGSGAVFMTTLGASGAQIDWFEPAAASWGAALRERR